MRGTDNTRQSEDVRRPREWPKVVHTRREFVQAYPQQSPDPIRQGATPASPARQQITWYLNDDKHEFGMLGGKFAYAEPLAEAEMSEALIDGGPYQGLIYRPDFTTYADTIYG